MNVIKLILKDFKAHWRYWLDGLVLLFVISTLFIYMMLLQNAKFDPEVLFYFMVMLLSTSVVSLLFMKLDELSKVDEIFVSLPITKTEIIIAKYISSIVLVMLALPVHFLGVQLGVYFYGGQGLPDVEITYNPLLWLSMGAVLLFFKSYAYPLYFKFGLSIGVAIQSAIQFLLIILLILSINVFNFQIPFNNLIEWVFSQNGYLVFAVIACALMALISLSITLSSKLYKNKEI